MNYNAIAHGEPKQLSSSIMTALHPIPDDSPAHILYGPSTARIRVRTALRRRYLSCVPSRGCLTH